MITRTFHAETMMLALEQVKKDLGMDALVVSARQIPGGQPWQVWRKPMVEVIAVRLEPGEDASTAVGLDSKEKPAISSKKTATKDLTRKDTILPKQINAALPSQSTKHTVQSSAAPVQTSEKAAIAVREMESTENTATFPSQDVVEIQGKRIKTKPAGDAKLDLLQQLGRDETLEDIRIVQAPASSKSPLPPLQLPQLPWQPPQGVPEGIEGSWPVLQKLFNQLIRQGVEVGMVRRVCQLSADTLGYQTAMDEKKLVEHLRRQLEVYIKVHREPAHKERQIICMVGSSGAGKTSFSAKLAVRYRKELKRSVAWVSADTIRTGGIAEARAFTEAINIPMQVAYTPQECSSIVESFYGNDLIIVDTPACNPRNEESLVEIGSLLTAIPDRTTWIVVPAIAKENDMMNAVGAFSIFKPRALVVTKWMRPILWNSI